MTKTFAGGTDLFLHHWIITMPLQLTLLQCACRATSTGGERGECVYQKRRGSHLHCKKNKEKIKKENMHVRCSSHTTMVCECDQGRSSPLSNALLVALKNYALRYKILAFPLTRAVPVSGQSCEKIVKQAGLNSYAVGRTKVLFWQILSSTICTCYVSNSNLYSAFFLSKVLPF